MMAFKQIRGFKSRRQRKYEDLRTAGFTEKEAKIYSSLTLKNAPYLLRMIRDRERSLRNFRAAGGTKKDFERKVIRGEYDKNGWLTDLGGIDPWKRYRNRRDLYIKDHPDWKTPEPKTKSPREPIDPLFLKRKRPPRKSKNWWVEYERVKGR